MDKKQSRRNKNVGREFQKACVAAILKHYPQLTDQDVKSNPSGQAGEDLLLTARAREQLFGLTFECKQHQSLNIWAALEQSVRHLDPSVGANIPVVLFRRTNQDNTKLVIDFEVYLTLTSASARYAEENEQLKTKLEETKKELEMKAETLQLIKDAVQAVAIREAAKKDPSKQKLTEEEHKILSSLLDKEEEQ